MTVSTVDQGTTTVLPCRPVYVDGFTLSTSVRRQFQPSTSVRRLFELSTRVRRLFELSTRVRRLFQLSTSVRRLFELSTIVRRLFHLVDYGTSTISKSNPRPIMVGFLAIDLDECGWTRRGGFVDAYIILIPDWSNF